MVDRSPRSTHVARLASTLALLLGGCTVDGIAILPGPELELGDEFGDDEDSEAGDGSEAGDSQGTGGQSEPLPEPQNGEPFAMACKISVGLDAALPCDAAPASDTLDPVIAWTWTGPNLEDSVIVTPLVANLDDDNGDGTIDLCDQPDVIVLAVNLPASKDEPTPPGHIYVLDSTDGTTKQMFQHAIDASATPALADLDDDGVPEIIAFQRVQDDVNALHARRVIAFEADGSVRWVSETWVTTLGGGALAIADLDADGTPEILAPEHVLSADGELLWAPPEPPLADSLPVAADLDLDGDLEVLFGRSVYAHDGEHLFDLPLPGIQNAGVSAIANFDDDPEPEIYVHSDRHWVFEHDGTPKVACGSNSSKSGPATIVDINGDGQAEILANHGGWFRAATLVEVGTATYCQFEWSVKVSDGVGAAFDFLGDGSAEPIYADLDWVRIFDDTGTPIFEFERSARPSMANPVVADADNDGAAELILVSSEPEGGDPEVSTRASVMFVQNRDDRFAPTRRIWNQHAYYATNIREDARVPDSLELLWLDGSKDFRVNPAPSYDGQQCQNPVLP